MRRSSGVLFGLLSVAIFGGCASHPPLRQAKTSIWIVTWAVGT